MALGSRVLVGSVRLSRAPVSPGSCPPAAGATSHVALLFHFLGLPTHSEQDAKSPQPDPPTPPTPAATARPSNTTDTCSHRQTLQHHRHLQPPPDPPTPPTPAATARPSNTTDTSHTRPSVCLQPHPIMALGSQASRCSCVTQCRCLPPASALVRPSLWKILL
nr:formin-like protein 20 [Macaca nemestrina]